MSHNCDMILFNFYRNWLIHKVLVSDFEGSNPSLTAKLKARPDGRAFCIWATVFPDAHRGRVRTLAEFEQSSLPR